MPRIRTIKPEFPQSESIGRLSRDARLCFIQLWTIADDSGLARASSRMLASLLYPYDDDAKSGIGVWLDELDRSGHIKRYTVNGDHYLEICNWLKHQKIDRPSQSRLPPFDEASRTFDVSSTTDLVPGPRIKDLGYGGDSVKGEGNGKAKPAKRATPLPEPWIIEEGDDLWNYAIAQGRTPSQIEADNEHFENHHRAKGSLMKDWKAAFRTWTNRAIEIDARRNH